MSSQNLSVFGSGSAESCMGDDPELGFTWVVARAVIGYIS